MRKAISPLIAVIMLIAFTMIVAGILAGWATQFVTQSRENLQFCSRAQILMQRAYYDNTTGNLTISLYNTGDVTLQGFTVLLTYDKETTSEKFEDVQIEHQDIEQLVVSTDDTLTQVAVHSMECEGAQDVIDRYGIQGLGFRA